ncbi:MAG: bifunctional diaminohydroxyphosphoribosylaminopyrimidine deaminase/5-amino-6-(5-phosphoribosylamino)uracil reductase RibD [Verrucomicrobiales bacterium]|nr:bifunctional diaminohydroxyphosphoribosylaminopyrimidine deaminase/5-amino-6-(5-phosphoribosylamino)uracil reductase RibD [Verrucomicrobiales bacterium]
MPPTEDDERYLRAALEQGEKGLGRTSPNPAVGAVIVRKGEIIGRGWHRKAGGAHAEVEAIQDAVANVGREALDGSAIYVTLEPCSTQGKTPPCVQAILDAGIARVVTGATDPNPAHAGAGFEILRKAGVEVTTGVLVEEANHLIRYFAKRITTGLPFVIAKTAATLDGRTTLGPGQSQWISSSESREDVQRLRRECDAILVGGETLRQDNPSLTRRRRDIVDSEQPLRVVLTSDEALPEGHSLFTDEHKDRTRVYLGISLRESLIQLAGEGVNAVLLESGGRLLGHALEDQLVDEVVLYLAPKLGGGATRLLPVDNVLTNLGDLDVAKIGRDLRIVGRPRYSSQGTEP